MKAITWRRWVLISITAAALTPALQPAMAESSRLPAGLPALPGIGESMQRDMRLGLALHGFDPVAYQANGKAVPGHADLEFVHNGVVWRFATEANREAFRDAPLAYEPAFSGFDALGIADGRLAESNPLRFAVVSSRLFMFSSDESRKRFVADAEMRRMAEASWPEISRQILR